MTIALCILSTLYLAIMLRVWYWVLTDLGLAREVWDALTDCIQTVRMLGRRR